MKLQNAKGMKDYMPEEMIALTEIMKTLEAHFQKAGFNPVSTPMLERFDVLSAKYAGGAEILKETFKLTDQGERELGLRYDLTVPFARIIGQNPQLKFPFKRYQMEKVYRDGPIGAGRYREFWQCDIDVVGSNSMKAEAELLSIVEAFFKEIGLDIRITVNNRKFMNAVLRSFGVIELDPLILIIDRYEKEPRETLVKEINALGFDGDGIISAFESATLDSISDFDGAKEIEDLFTITKQLGLSSLQFNPVLARGLSYYTGTVYEVKLHNNPITSTVCAGGRYDTMIGNFLDSKESYPAVGVSFGLSRIFDALKAADKVVEKKTVTDVFVISMQEDAYALDIVSKLRDVHINTETDIMDRKLKKNLEYANALGIPFVIIVGENEAKDNLVTLKDLSTGDQKLCSLDDAITIIKKL